MNKLKRSKENYGSGGGSTYFESDLFRVVHWSMMGGTRKRTTIQSYFLDTDDNIQFDDHINFLNSDAACIYQLKPNEIIHMIEKARKIGDKEGQKNKIQEIKKCLEIK